MTGYFSTRALKNRRLKDETTTKKRRMDTMEIKFSVEIKSLTPQATAFQQLTSKPLLTDIRDE